MYEDPAVDPGELRERIVPDSPPRLRQRLPAFKALRGHRDSLNPPIAPRLIRIDDIRRRALLNPTLLLILQIEQMLLPGYKLLEKQNLARRIEVGLAVVHEGRNQLARGQPRVSVKLELLRELSAGERRGGLELGVEDRIGGVLVPSGVQLGDAAGEIGPVAVAGLEVLRVLRDAIVDGIDGLDEVLSCAKAVNIHHFGGREKCVPCRARNRCA